MRSTRVHRRPAVLLIAMGCLVLAGACSDADTAGEDRSGTASTSTSRAEDPAAEEGAVEGDGDGSTAGSEQPEAGTTGPADGPEEPWRTTSLGELPPTFPADIPLPEGHTIQVATESTGEGPKSYVVQLEAAGSPASVCEGISTRFSDGGWQVLQAVTPERRGGTSSVVHSNALLLVSVGCIPGRAPETTAVTYSVVPAGLVLPPGEAPGGASG